MSALTVTLGGDLAGLKAAMVGAVDLVSASARRMAKISSAGLAGLGKGGSAALGKGFDVAATGIRAGIAGLGKSGGEALGKGFDMAGIALKAGIGAALAGGAVAMGVGVKAVTKAADFEQTKVAFTTLIGDAAKAEETLAKLRELGAETPFEFPELADAGRKLIAFGEKADTVPETLRRIGDVSAGVQAPIKEIAEIYGKARVQGRLFAEDVNQLTGRGIPVIGELAKQFGVGESEVRKLVESGKVGFPQIEKAFVNMTSKGGKFHGMMEEQSKTTKGLFSTLKDAFGEVFLALGTPINDAIRPLVAEAIKMVSTLTPLAAEAGARIKDAIMFVITAFRSGQVLDLVTASLKLGFAVGINSLVNGFRRAVEFFWNLITDGQMWKGLGTTLMGVAAGFGAGLLNAFQTPVVYLQAGIEWVIAHLLKGLAKIPGMSDLMGFGPQDINTNFGDILESRMQDGAELFGLNFKQLIKEAEALMANGAPLLAERVAAAARKAGESTSTDLIDTKELKNTFDDLVTAIRDAMPIPEEVVAAATSATSNPTEILAEAVGRLEPIVTSLGKVGGGGYSAGGVLDAQKENNKLTEKTNGLLTDLNKTVGKLTRTGVARFA